MSPYRRAGITTAATEQSTASVTADGSQTSEPSTAAPGTPSSDPPGAAPGADQSPRSESDAVGAPDTSAGPLVALLMALLALGFFLLRALE